MQYQDGVLSTPTGAEREKVAAVAETVPEWSLDEYRAEFRPILALRGVDPDVRLAIFGTSGPAGAALNTVGVLRLDDGRYLLGNWRRHPLAPDYSPFLVLPDLEPSTVWDALIEVLPCCGMGTPALGPVIDFVSVCAPAELAGAVRDAFLEVAAEPDLRMTGPADRRAVPPAGPPRAFPEAHARGPLTLFGGE